MQNRQSNGSVGMGYMTKQSKLGQSGLCQRVQGTGCKENLMIFAAITACTGTQH